MYKNRFEWKVERMKKKITIEEIADYIGCSGSLISLYENNKRGMKWDKVEGYKEYIIEKEV